MITAEAVQAFWQVHSCYLHTIDQKQAFDAGTVAFTVGGLVTGGTSHATGTVKSLVLSSGAWSGTAAGYLVLSNVTGTFQNNEALTCTTAGAATADGVNADYKDAYGKKTQTASATATPCQFVNLKAPPGNTENGWSGRFPAVMFPAGTVLFSPPPNQRLTSTETGFTGTYEIQWPPVYYPDTADGVDHITCGLKAVT